MIVKNNKPVGRWFFYKVNGVALKEYIAGYSEMDIPGLTNESQIIYNGHDQALRNVEDKFGKSFSNTWAVPSDPAGEFTYYSVSAVTWGDYTSGGTMSPTGSAVQVPEGENQIFTMATSSGFFVSAATLDGSSVINSVSNSAQTATYTIENIAQDHIFLAQFGYETFAWSGTTLGESGGTISPSGLTITIGRGDSQTITMTPESNYYLSEFNLDGDNYVSAVTGSVSAVTTYAVDNIIGTLEFSALYLPFGS